MIVITPPGIGPLRIREKNVVMSGPILLARVELSTFTAFEEVESEKLYVAEVTVPGEDCV